MNKRSGGKGIGKELKSKPDVMSSSGVMYFYVSKKN